MAETAQAAARKWKTSCVRLVCREVQAARAKVARAKCTTAAAGDQPPARPVTRRATSAHAR